MNESRSQPPDTPPDGLWERAVRLARDLGIDWRDGRGGGVYRLESKDRGPLWRAHSTWGGLGALVDVDVSTGAIVRVQEEDFETVGRPIVMPERYRPTRDEAVLFLQDKFQKVGWSWPLEVDATWDESNCIWKFRSTTEKEALQAEVRGKRGALRLMMMLRSKS